jgi:hypothetical protein
MESVLLWWMRVPLRLLHLSLRGALSEAGLSVGSACWCPGSELARARGNNYCFPPCCDGAVVLAAAGGVSSVTEVKDDRCHATCWALALRSFR